MGVWVICVVVLLLDRGEAETNARDTEALRAFQGGVQDPLSKLENWKGDDPCEQSWEGIICAPDAAGVQHVTEIHLLNSNLSGILSADIGSLTALKVLDLMWNNLSGSIPPSIGNLLSLELLLLNGNSFTGQLPNELGNLVNLNRLQVDQNKLSGPIPSSFTNLVNAKHLHMNDNAFGGSVPSGLGRLPAIHILLDNNNLTGKLPADIGNISQLQILQLDNNPFEAQEIPSAYTTSLVQLLKLSMKNCTLRGSLPDLSALKKLQYLDLSNNQMDGVISNISLPSLTTMDLSNNLFTGDIPNEAAGIDTLELLSLQSNVMNGSLDPLLLALQSRTNDNILVLDLQGNSLTVSSFPTFSIPNNVKLWLFGNAQVCIWNAAFKFCEHQSLDSLPDHGPSDNSNINNCPKDICNPDVDELVPGLAADGNCKCASPIRVLVRLKSPGFRFFEPHVRAYEKYMTTGLGVSHLSVTSYYWAKQRLLVKLSIFPSMQGDDRRFDQPEVKRVFLAFTEWTIPDSPLFGPRELLSFDPPYGIELFTSEGAASNKKVFASAIPVFAGILVGVVGIVGTVLVCFVQKLKDKDGDKSWKKRRSLSFKVEGVTGFSWEEMDRATDSFNESNQIGQGGYGKVYKGVLDDGTIVAIKRAEEASRNGASEFHNEIQLLSRLHHRNLVSLIGYYVDENEQMLVYEFMSGGSLRDHLSPTLTSPLNVRSRLVIALGAARGILYLHAEANPPIFHRDIKSTNILLDEKNNPKVADFGLSKLAPVSDADGLSGHVSTVVRGTPGYLDPEYFLTHKLTDKSDVYSFGVVLLELLTGMPPISQGKNIVREVRSAFEAGMILDMVDSRMGPLSCELLERFVRLGLSCSSDEPQARPSMSDVVRDLEALRLATSRPESLQSTADDEPGSSFRRLDKSAVLSEKLAENDDSQYIGVLLPR